VVLGTVGYMSPEQVRAQTVDHRSDIFSFGAVLYEMLSGTRAFKGATAADTITAILSSEPADLAGDHALVTPALDRIVRHCLEKTPEMRFQSARDIAFNLEALSTVSVTGTAVAAARPAPRPTMRYLALAAVVVAVAAIAATGLWRLASASRSNPVFRQVTFRHGELDNARFTADGQNIIYTASWEGAPPELFTVPAGQDGGRSLGIQNARLLAVSKTGELAIALAPRKSGGNFLVPGTLARGLMAGGAPKAEIENVTEADYAPDGKSLAIVRSVPDQRITQLEFPIGTVLYKSPLLSDLRFSPDGKYLAAIEHSSAGDDRGNAVILRATGEKVATGPLRDSQRGLAWSPAGDEIRLTSPLADARLFGLDLKGRSRELLNMPGRFFLRDVAADGRILIDEGDTRRGIVVVADNGESQRDVSWLDYSFLRAISKDGKTILFEEEGHSTNGAYRTFVRNVDGSPAVEVGLGYGVAISDDNAWTLSMRLDPAPELWLQPVGAGQARKLTPAGWTAANAARFFADGKRIAFVAREPNRRNRTYIQTLDGGAPRAMTDEGVAGVLISPDQHWIAVQSPAGPALAPVEGGALKPIQGTQPGDSPRGWSDDGQLYVANGQMTLLRIDKLNPFTGVRTRWRELRVPAIVGVRPALPFITPDGKTYAYGYGLGFSDLYVMTGVR
jgi:Tol biopolymer transport system component